MIHTNGDKSQQKMFFFFQTLEKTTTRQACQKFIYIYYIHKIQNIETSEEMRFQEWAMRRLPQVEQIRRRLDLL